MSVLTSDQLGQLAKDYQKIASELLKFKLENANNMSITEFQDLGSRITLIVHNSNILAAMATYQTAEDISDSLNTLTDSADKIDATLKKIQKVQDIIDIAAMAINVGTNILSGNLKGTVQSIGEFAKKIGVAVKI
ncbi:MAG: hypothetical protein ABI863_22440 [Ginsengibacter sp.]